MRFLLLALMLSLSGCGFGLFGGNREAPPEQAVADPLAPLPDGTVLVDTLVSVVPEPALRGLIIKSTALARTQGYSAAELRPLNEGAPDENGIVTFEFRVRPPGITMDPGPEAARRLIAATFVADNDLDEIAGFRVLSATNIVNLTR